MRCRRSERVRFARWCCEANGLLYTSVLKSCTRDRWIGWHEKDSITRLHLIANQSRFLIPKPMPNLTLRTLSLIGKRIALDRPRWINHPTPLTETYVDRERSRGLADVPDSLLGRGLPKPRGGQTNRSDRQRHHQSQCIRRNRDSAPSPLGALERRAGTGPICECGDQKIAGRSIRPYEDFVPMRVPFLAIFT